MNKPDHACVFIGARRDAMIAHSRLTGRGIFAEIMDVSMEDALAETWMGLSSVLVAPGDMEAAKQVVREVLEDLQVPPRERDVDG